MNREALRQWLADAVADATDGAVSADGVCDPGVSLTDLGMDSLGFLRLIDAIESEYGIEIAFDGAEAVPDTIEAFVERLVRGSAPR